MAAAFELHERRVPFVLLEASERLGGLIRTEKIDGFTVEAGPDSILAYKPAALAFVDALGLTPRLIAATPPRTAYVAARGELHALPSPSALGVPLTISGALGYDLLPVAARLRLLAEPWIHGIEPADDESVASFFARRFGPEVVPLIAEPLLGGIHAGDVEALSIRSVFPRVAAAAAQGSVLRALRAAPPSPEGLFRSFDSGMSTLVTAVEARLDPASITRGACVDAIVREGEAWTVRAGERSWSADGVLLTTPAFVVARLLATIDAAAAALCGQVPYVSTASIALAWARRAVRHPLNGSGFVVARRHSDLRITACTWVSSKWAGRAPEGTALLRAFIGGAHDPGAVRERDDDLIAIARRETAAVLGITGEPLFARVWRWRDGSPQHNVGHLRRVAAIEERLAHHPGLFVAGSGFRGIGIPDCIAEGRAAAGRALEYVRMAR